MPEAQTSSPGRLPNEPTCLILFIVVAIAGSKRSNTQETMRSYVHEYVVVEYAVFVFGVAPFFCFLQ